MQNLDNFILLDEVITAFLEGEKLIASICAGPSLLGKRGYLKDKKFKILKKNFTTKIGEIDIIAKKDDTIIFVEVKERGTKRFGMPREAVTPYKQNKIRTVASQYLTKMKQTDAKVRFDVVEILGDTITHIENAF